MKILLIIPKRAKTILPSPDVGLAYIASMARYTGAQVRILDAHLEGIEPKNIINYLDGESVVGFKMLTIDAYQVREYARAIKEHDPRILTIAGGHHPSALPNEVIKYREIDRIIVGEGEEPMRQLVKGEEPIPALVEDLDSLEFPAWDLFKLEKYPVLPGSGGRFLPVITSRGCPSRCTFCNSRNMHGDRIRRRSPENVIAEIEWLVKNFKIDRVSIFDDNFIYYKSHVKAICKLFKERDFGIKLDIPQGIRIDKIDEDVVSALEEAGCDYVGIGIESGVQRILNVAKKGTTVPKIREKVKLIKENSDIKIMGFFIIGFPEEDEIDIMQTIDFALDLKLDFATFTILTPFPGTQIFKEMVREGHLSTDNINWEDLLLDKETFKHPFLSRKRLKQLQRLAYRSFYLRPSKIKFLMRMLREWSIGSYARRGFSIFKS